MIVNMIPGPVRVPLRVRLAMLKPIGYHKEHEFRELYESIIENAKYVFQTEKDVFVLSASGTGGIECVISNIVQPHDKIVVGVHGFFGEAIRDTIKLYGGKPIEVRSEWNKAPAPENFEKVLERENNVKAVFIVSNETSTGVKVLDLERIGSLAERYETLFVVDATSMLGGDELLTDEWKIDVCVSGSQKCLACPPGLSIISISKRAWEAIERAKLRSNYFNLLAYRDSFNNFKETPYTPALPLFCALDEALEMIKEEALEKRIKRHQICASALYSAIESLEVPLFADKRFRSNTVIAASSPPSISNRDLLNLMKARYGVVIADGVGTLRGAMFRIGNMGTTSAFEVTATVHALEDALVELGQKFERGRGIEACREILSKLLSLGEEDERRC